MDRPEYSYIGIKPCGCVVCAIVDDQKDKKHVGKMVAEWIADGLTIERVTHEYVRQHFTWNCPHKEELVKDEQLKLGF